MNILKPIANFFVAKEVKCSMTQLQEDFGTFPPVPLKCEPSRSSFTIVRVRGIGGIVNDAQLTMKMTHIPQAEFAAHQRDSAQLRAMKERLAVGQQAFAEAAAVFNEFKIPALAQRILFWTMAIKNAIGARHRRKREGLGSFLPLAGSDGRITLRIGPSKRGTSMDAVLSHEHVHLLQHKFGLSTTRYLRNPDDLIAEEYNGDSSVLYMFEDIEVEARLHEIVLSYYRKARALPLTVDAFLQALAGCEHMSEQVVQALKSRGVQLPSSVLSYQAREAVMAEDLDDILFAIKDIDCRYRFITEVLTVMYGNLLRYYGDERSSQIFMEQIERPNLYDTLYI